MIPNTSNILKFFIKEKNVRKDTEKAKVVLDLRWITLNNNKPVVLKLPISSKEVSGSLDVEITGKSKNYTNPTRDPEALPGAKLEKALKEGQLTITAGCDKEKHVVHVAENNIINLKKLINHENTLRSFGTTQKKS